jgi:hypothetical protein
VHATLSILLDALGDLDAALLRELDQDARGGRARPPERTRRALRASPAAR